MIELRPSDTIFHAEGGWFAAKWHFSFDRYRDPEHTSWGDLRVFNDDRLVPGAVWPMHPHRDIEGITYVAEGAFEHADSLGNGGVLPPGGVQRMTLGAGAWHSERNHSQTEPMRFIQMWIMPARLGLPPSVEQRSFDEATRRDRLRPVLVPAPGYGSAGAPTDPDAVTVHQDAAVYAGLLSGGVRVRHAFRDGFGGYLFVVHGSVEVHTEGGEGGALDEGGAARIGGEPAVSIAADPDGAEVLLVETRLDGPPAPGG
ncbi:MAG TPA: pirin family protein [Candidatus Limnocylindrales bacterium]|nr:pirin family protein [Candidatus Limnocylindrales bacterium]